MMEEPWPGVKMTRACLCDTMNTQPFEIVSYTNTLKITFSVPNMSPAHDYNDFFFEGEYEMIDSPASFMPGCDAMSRHVGGRHGNFTLGSGRHDACDTMPRLVTAADGAFLFLRINGFSATETNCGIASRINVFAAGGSTPIASICPERRDTSTHVFSSGWNDDSKNQIGSLADLSYHNTQPNITLKHDLDYNSVLYKQQQEELIRQKQQQLYYQNRGKRFYQKQQQHSRDLVVEYAGDYSGSS